MSNEKDKNLTRFLLTFFLGWIGSIIINATDLKPKGHKSRTLAYFFLSSFTFGIYGLVAAISNLSFDPAKDSNIGYIRESGYVYNPNSSQSNDVDYVAPKQPKKQEPTMSLFIQKGIVVLMAIFSIFTLSFTLCSINPTYAFNRLYYKVNGFNFITFQSKLIDDDFTWALYLIGVLCILFLLTSLALLVLSIFNFSLTKSFNSTIIITSIVIATLYMIIGIIFVTICNDGFPVPYYTTGAYIPFLIQIGLLIAHIVCGKNKMLTNLKFNYEIEQPKESPALSKTNESPVLSKVTEEEQKIKKYKELLEKELITEEDFNAKRKQILGL